LKSAEISLDVTYDCPFDCPFCSSREGAAPMRMSAGVASSCAEFMQNLRSLRGSNVEIAITGGEPLGFRDLNAYLRAWSKHVSEAILCTTCGLDMLPSQWSALAGAGLSTVRMSLHCVSAHSCLEIFGNAYCPGIVEANVDRLTKAGIALDVNFLLTTPTASHFQEVLEFCVQKPVRSIRVLGLSRQGRAPLNWTQLNMPPQVQVEVAQRIRAQCAQVGLPVEFSGLMSVSPCTHSDNDSACLGGSSFFHINTNGDIYPCPSVKSLPEFRIASVMDSSAERLLKSPAGPRECVVVAPESLCTASHV